MDEKIKKIIDEVLEDVCGTRADCGRWKYKFDKDYYYKLSESSVQKAISQQENPAYAIECELYDAYEQAISDAIYDISAQVLDKAEAEGIDIEYEDIRDMVWENIVFDFDLDNYLADRVAVCITMDAGTMNYEYAQNNLGKLQDSDKYELERPCDLLWLANQQGYSDPQFEYAINNDTESKFLESVKQEVNNTCYYINALTFMVYITIDNLFEIVEAINKEKDKNDSYYYEEREGNGYIVIPKKTTCGLVNFSSGCGGVLEIALEKDVVLPIKAIGHVFVDSECPIGYGVQQIYGTNESTFHKCHIKVVEDKDDLTDRMF